MSEYPLESFIFYRSFRDAIEEMSDEDKLATLLAITDYALYGVEPKLKGVMPRAVFTVVRPSIDTNIAKREGGRKGGRPQKEPMVKDSKNHRFSKRKSTDTDTVADTGTVAGTDTGADTEAVTQTDDGESAPQAPSPPSAPPVIGLPLNDGTEYGVTEEQCQEWAELYPAVDVLQELREMRGWLDSNKNRRKTKRGVCRFITNWLAQEQDRGRSSREERGDTHGAVSGSGANQGQPAKTWGVPVVEL